MAVNTIWVFAEAADGTPTHGTLELLTKARSLGGTVEAFYGGDGAAAIAAALGEYGATKVHATGDLGGKLQGVPSPRRCHRRGHRRRQRHPTSSCSAPPTTAATSPARLSVKLDRTVLTNNVDVAVDGDTVSVTTPIFGGSTTSSPPPSPGPRRTWCSVRSPSWPSRPAAAPPRSSLHRCPISAPPAPPRSPPPRRGVHRPQARRGRRRRVRRPWSRRGRQVRPDRGAGQARSRAPRRLPRHRRRRLGALLLPGGPDRQGREAHGVHRRRHLGRHPAHGGHEGLEEHHRDQQGQGGPDLSASPTSASWATSTRCCPS
jgi:hypothetical protein